MQTVLITLSEKDLHSLIKTTIEDALSKVPQSTPQIESNKLLGIEDVCQLFDISKPTLHNWKREGRLPFHRMGSRVYFKEAEVIAAMQGTKIRRK